MECSEARELVIAHARGELGEDEAARLTEHMAGCKLCTAEYDVARRMLYSAKAADPRRVEAWAEGILRRSITERSSDIHLDPATDGGLSIRFRTDGLLKEVEHHDRLVAQALVDAVLRLAGLPTEAIDAARRRPVSGRILREVDNEKYDFRVSGFPMIDGPKLTIRVYTPQIRRVSLDELGMAREDQTRLERWRARPSGLLLIAAPVGSGKTTTQYALLERGASEGSHTVALERHPSARLPHVNQAALDPSAGLGHAAALRAIMRCDPDVIMVEEVPDRETAGLLSDVAITGHLVIAGVEVGGAVAAVRRLLDLGADSWTLSQTLLGVSAQRLARRICPHCRVERTSPPRSLQALGWEPAEAPATFAGEGCEKCRKRGLLGRIAFFETLEATPAVAARIADNAPAEGLLTAAGDSLSPFLADARRKVAEGLVSVEEAARVVRQA